MPNIRVASYMMDKGSLQAAMEKLFELGQRVIAPTRAPKGDIFFREVSDVSQIVTDFGNSLVSPVEHLRPPKEVYFRYELTEEGPPEVSPPPAPEPFVLFHLRPCDVAAVECLDHFFIERQPVDVLYQQRRQAATLIAMACVEPAAETCFCPCCEGGGPVAASGYDVQLTLVDEKYLVEVATDKGERIRALWEDLLETAPAELITQRDEQAEYAVRELFSSLQANMAAAVRRVSAETVTRETWEAIAEHCYSCGGCSFMCPVCTCFDVNDVKFDDNTGMRVRQMDSCRLFGYPREAAGAIRGFETPYRARMYAFHKLGYDHVLERGRYGCVGCGRCIMTCLGHMGMPTICKLARRPPVAADRTPQKS